MLRSLVIFSLLAALSVTATPAHAQKPVPDSDAPPRASKDWLPSDTWVMQRWLPYSESRLSQVLRTDRYELGPWLRVGRRNLADLARKKGIAPSRAIREVMAPERTRVSRKQFRVLTQRARRTFTQRHLMQHMLFHNLHTRYANAGWRLGIGLGWPQIGVFRAKGMSYAEIAEHNGRSREALFARVRAAVLRAARQGVRTRSTSPTQARAQAKRDLAAVEPFGLWKRQRPASKASSSAAAPKRQVAQLCFLRRGR